LKSYNYYDFIQLLQNFKPHGLHLTVNKIWYYHMGTAWFTHHNIKAETQLTEMSTQTSFNNYTWWLLNKITIYFIKLILHQRFWMFSLNMPQVTPYLTFCYQKNITHGPDKLSSDSVHCITSSVKKTQQNIVSSILFGNQRKHRMLCL